MYKKTKYTPLKLALIGGGINSTIGETHFLASQLDKCFEIVSGCFSKNYKTSLITAKNWNISKKRVYKNLKDLINKEKKLVDAFVVLSPTPNHFSVLRKLINSDLSIICEKPLVSSLNQALILKKEIKKSQSFVAVTYNYTGYPLVREIKEIVKRGRIGKILNIHFEMPQEVFLRKNIKRLKIQKWRLNDQKIPTICLDLGIHLYNLSWFITEKEPLKLISDFSNLASKKNLVDDVKIWLKYKNGMNGSFWISKSALGNRNGLKLEIYGERGSVIWRHSSPEKIELNHNDGSKKILDRSSKAFVLNFKRYNRYRAGHPAGFIEAFANAYTDIADALIAHKKRKKKQNKYVFGFQHSLKGIKFLETASKANLTKKWLKIN